MSSTGTCYKSNSIVFTSLASIESFRTIFQHEIPQHSLQLIAQDSLIQSSLQIDSEQMPHRTLIAQNISLNLPSSQKQLTEQFSILSIILKNIACTLLTSSKTKNVQLFVSLLQAQISNVSYQINWKAIHYLQNRCPKFECCPYSYLSIC